MVSAYYKNAEMLYRLYKTLYKNIL